MTNTLTNIITLMLTAPDDADTLCSDVRHGIALDCKSRQSAGAPRAALARPSAPSLQLALFDMHIQVAPTRGGVGFRNPLGQSPRRRVGSVPARA